MRCVCVLFGVVLLLGCNDRGPFDRQEFGNGGSGGATTTTSGSGDLFTTTTGSGVAPACTGECVASADGPFVRITMVSIGKPDEVKPCPSWAPVGFEGYAGMQIDPHTCPSCSCGPAACALPEEMHASAAKCANADGASSMTWDAPPAWEGVCSADGPIAAGLKCEGVPCVQSLTIDAPAVEPCKPVVDGKVSLPKPQWNTMARECRIDVSKDGCDPLESCAPAPPEGFVLCMSVAGEGYECTKEYPEHFVVFDTVDDSRECSPCACSDPKGADCSALVSVFTDGACGALLGSFPVSSAMDNACTDLPPGSPLGSKSAKLTVDKPGSCAPSGGEPSGILQPAGPVTFCCQKPNLEPPK